PLYHLYHQKGDSSGLSNLTQQKRNKQELVKVSGFYKSELEDYISSWNKKEDAVYVSLMCRIGNLMFQIAAGAAIAKRNNKRLIAVLSDYQTPQPDNISLKEYIDPFLTNILRHIDVIDKNPDRYRLYVEPYFHYKAIKFEDGLYLHGLFQSEKYLDRELTLQLFKIDEVTEKYIQSNYEDILQLKPTAINVRRGDYLKLQDLHPVCTLDYFNAAIKIIGEQSSFLVISDDVEWCKENFIGDNFYFTNETNAVVDLYLQTLCENNIISNSTFSWWGAWLNENPNKIVIAPKLWFGPSNARHDTKDLIPDSWIKI
ncbi:MAG: alpha-1,2-fucosyltransferase, partial [Tannerellaceae bacterium]